MRLPWVSHAASGSIDLDMGQISERLFLQKQDAEADSFCTAGTSNDSQVPPSLPPSVHYYLHEFKLRAQIASCPGVQGATSHRCCDFLSMCVAQSWLKDREGWWIMMIKWRGLGSRMWPCYFLLDRLPSLPLAPGRNCNPQSSRSPIPKTTQPVPVPHSSADGSAECEEASPRMILCMDSLGRVPFKA